jgi:signal transduction histidine kinase
VFLTREEPLNLCQPLLLLLPALTAMFPALKICCRNTKSCATVFQRTTNALASAAHDLKTPLSILNGYVELLQSEKLGSLNERQHEVLRDMQASGKRLQQFIQDFLTYSALETGGLRMQFEAGNINDCLSEVCRLWSNRFQEKGLALYFLANDKLPIFPFRFSEGGAHDFEPAGKFIQVHAPGRDRVAAR